MTEHQSRGEAMAYNNASNEIFHKIARVLWVDAWVSEQERRGKYLGDCELMDSAPPTPNDYLIDAARLAGYVECATGLEIHSVVNELDAKDWGKAAFYITMDSLGHGVGVLSEYPDADWYEPTIFECYSCADDYMT